MKTPLLAVVFAALSAPAFAATITSTAFSKSAYDSAVGSMGSAVVENFESLSEGNIANEYATPVATQESFRPRRVPLLRQYIDVLKQPSDALKASLPPEQLSKKA